MPDLVIQSAREVLLSTLGGEEAVGVLLDKLQGEPIGHSELLSLAETFVHESWTHAYPFRGGDNLRISLGIPARDAASVSIRARRAAGCPDVLAFVESQITKRN